MANGGWDIVVANLTAEVLDELAEPLARATRPGGILIGSGIIAEKSDLAAYALMEAGLRLIDAISDESGDWRAIVLMHPNAGDKLDDARSRSASGPGRYAL